MGPPERKMNQLELGIQSASHITFCFSWGKVLYHFVMAEQYVQSEEAQTTEVCQPACSTASWELGWGPVEGGRKGDRFSVELAELEKCLGFLA